MPQTRTTFPRGRKLFRYRFLNSLLTKWRGPRVWRGDRLAKCVRKENLVYFDRHTTINDAKRRVSAGIGRCSSAARLCPHAVNAILLIGLAAVTACAPSGEQTAGPGHSGGRGGGRSPGEFGRGERPETAVPVEVVEILPGMG